MSGAARGWRHLTIWVHAVSSISWMALALALLVMLATAVTTTDPAVTAAAASMAHLLDGVLLAQMANIALATGLMLSLTTAWGLTLHWWVLTKFVITVVQFVVGIAVLSPALNTAAATGLAPPVVFVAATALMAGAIAFQAWLSVAKPWPRTPWAGRGQRLPTAPAWVFALGVLAPLTDLALSFVVGFPPPFLSLTALIIAAVRRQRVRTAAPVRRERSLSRVPQDA